MAAFEYRQAEEIRVALTRHSVRYLVIGKSAAILLGFPDTTQDLDLFVERESENLRRLVAALCEVGFALNGSQATDIVSGKALVQLRNGPFDLDLIFTPDGIEGFADAWKRHVDMQGFPVCHPDDIIASKEVAHRRKDMESLLRLRSFREYWVRQRTSS